MNIPSRTMCTATLLLALGASAAAAAPISTLRIELDPAPELANPPLPDPDLYPIQLVVDDDTPEAALGVVDGGGSRQFFAFQRFAGPGQTSLLEEVWILFPADPAVPVGGAIEIAVFRDADGDPTNGATLASSWNATVQAADGVNFSIYTPPAPIPLDGPDDVLIGFVNRYLTSGGPPVSDVLYDTTASAGRSWLALWNAADPPSPPSLPGSQGTALLDDVVAGGGNWMIRGFGTTVSALEIPTLPSVGLIALAALLALAGGLALRSAKGRRNLASGGLS